MSVPLTHNTVTYRDFCDERHRVEARVLAEHFDSIDERFRAIDKATELAVAAQDKRLDSLNELRAMVTDQSRQYVPRETMDVRVNALEGRIRTMEQSLATSAGSQRVWALVAGAGTGLLSSIVVGLVLRLLT